MPPHLLFDPREFQNSVITEAYLIIIVSGEKTCQDSNETGYGYPSTKLLILQIILSSITLAGAAAVVIAAVIIIIITITLNIIYRLLLSETKTTTAGFSSLCSTRRVS